jgi:dTDP-4-dehydrorhamnose reductase
MRLLVYGATGQVARELFRRAPGATFLGRDRADFAQPDGVAAPVLEGAWDAVINAVAHTAVDRAESELDLAQAVNATAPGMIAAACAARGIPFLQVSTDYVFDGSGDRPWQPQDPTGPLGVYGATKLAGEQAVRAAGGCHAILRTSWVFSAHGANFVKTMLRLGAEREELRIVADQIGGPTPAGAIAEALLRMAETLQARPETAGTYHFSGVPETSWAGFAKEIFSQAGLACRVTEIPTADYPTPARRPLNSRLDCSSFTETFGLGRPDWRAHLADILTELRA